jgi:hypothetical protein
MAAHEVAGGQSLDLSAVDGRVEVPVEFAQRLELAEIGVLDAPFDAALAALSGLMASRRCRKST